MNETATANPVRAQFEEWARQENYDLHRSTGEGWACTEPAGEYSSEDTAGAWAGWQAALAQQAGAVGGECSFNCMATMSCDNSCAPQPTIPEVDWLTSRGNDPRVEVDSYAVAIEAALIYIGAERPDDDEPEEQWFWDKLTALLEIAQHNREGA